MKKLSRKFRSIAVYAGLVLLFLVIMGWIFYPSDKVADATHPSKGLNTQLPAVKERGDSTRDKLRFYADALQDSLKRAEQIQMDPYRRDSLTKSVYLSHVPTKYRSPSSNPDDQLDAKISLLNRPLPRVNYPVDMDGAPTQPQVVPTASDPEWESINATLDKIMAIQHPTPGNTAKLPHPGYSVSGEEQSDLTYFGKQTASSPLKNFYGDNTKAGPGLMAIIPSEQQLQNGTLVKLELGSAILVNGVRIPAGTFLYGMARFDNERLQIHIPSIRLDNQLLPVSLSVYDMDGLEGIYVPGSLNREVVKESADKAIQSMGVSRFGVLLPTEVAASGIGAVKSLLSKRVKQVRVTLTAGYKLLLRDNKQMGN
ncbi:MAG: conjugative transposon protein TraM [Chitinophagaceae bacterium]|nr:conjugative transposon protein TraM [Chitinophagaceae bacterium]